MPVVVIESTTDDAFLTGPDKDTLAEASNPTPNEAASVGTAFNTLPVGVSLKPTGKYFVYRSALRFDTSVIPDTAVINRATLFVMSASIGKFTYSSPVFDVFVGAATPAGNTLVAADFAKMDWGRTEPEYTKIPKGLSLGWNDIRFINSGLGGSNKTGVVLNERLTNHINKQGYTWYSLMMRPDVLGVPELEFGTPMLDSVSAYQVIFFRKGDFVGASQGHSTLIVEYDAEEETPYIPQAFTLIDRYGYKLDLSGDILIDNVEGLSNADIKYQSSELPFADVQLYLDYAFSPRVVDFTLNLHGGIGVHNEMWMARQRLMRFLSPLSAPFVIEIGTNDRRTFYIKDAVPVKTIEGSLSAHESSRLQKVNLRMQAFDPVIYEGEIQDSPLMTSVLADAEDGEMSLFLQNTGDYKAWPEIEVYGEVEDPKFEFFPGGGVVEVDYTQSTDDSFVIFTHPARRGVFELGTDNPIPIGDDTVFNLSFLVPPPGVAFGTNIVKITWTGAVIGVTRFTFRWNTTWLGL